MFTTSLCIILRIKIKQLAATRYTIHDSSRFRHLALYLGFFLITSIKASALIWSELLYRSIRIQASKAWWRTYCLCRVWRSLLYIHLCPSVHPSVSVCVLKRKPYSDYFILLNPGPFGDRNLNLSPTTLTSNITLEICYLQLPMLYNKKKKNE